MKELSKAISEKIYKMFVEEMKEIKVSKHQYIKKNVPELLILPSIVKKVSDKDIVIGSLSLRNLWSIEAIEDAIKTEIERNKE